MWCAGRRNQGVTLPREAVDRPLVRRPVHAHVGHRRHPLRQAELYKGHMEKALADNPGKPRPIFATMRHTVMYERKEDWEIPVKAATRQFGRRRCGGSRAGSRSSARRPPDRRCPWTIGGRDACRRASIPADQRAMRGR